MTDLFDGCRVDGAYDEVFAEPGVPHDQSRALHAALEAMSASDLDGRSAALAHAFRDQGIAFSLSGEERPFPLDLVPRVVQANKWSRIEQGVAQRVRVLEAFLADVHGPRAVLADGIVPRRVVTSSSSHVTAAYGVVPANGVRVHVSGIDLIRDEQGEFRVLEDNLRTPSSVSDVVENRRAMGRVFPEGWRRRRPRPGRCARASARTSPM